LSGLLLQVFNRQTPVMAIEMTGLIRSYAFVLAVMVLAGSPALGCACCTHEGQRNVATVEIDSGKRQQIESLRYGDKATLFTGEGDVAATEGITMPSASYDLTAKWVDNLLVFSFRDKSDRTGTLELARPKTVSLFEVDPRDSLDVGQGPILYKEWKISSPAAASGVFAPGAGPRHFLTLIIQGRGNSCTSDIDFSHWTLVMQGPKANYTLFGNLVTTK
jgi:hypothetical protein